MNKCFKNVSVLICNMMIFIDMKHIYTKALWGSSSIFKSANSLKTNMFEKQERDWAVTINRQGSIWRPSWLPGIRLPWGFWTPLHSEGCQPWPDEASMTAAEWARCWGSRSDHSPAISDSKTTVGWLPSRSCSLNFPVATPLLFFYKSFSQLFPFSKINLLNYLLNN